MNLGLGQNCLLALIWRTDDRGDLHPVKVVPFANFIGPGRCRDTQGCDDQNRTRLNDVERIDVGASKATLEHAGWPYRPEGMTAAQLNMPYCIATLLLEGDVFVDQFTGAMIADPTRIALSRKVEVREDPAITALGSKFRHMVKVTVRLKDGTVMDETVEAARGSEKNFASPADILAKFKKLAGKRLSPAQCDRIMNLVLGLDEIPDAGELVKALVREG